MVYNEIDADSEELNQGDIIRECPIHTVQKQESADTFTYTRLLRDLIVLSQSCDLVNEKTGKVLLAEVTSWILFKTAQIQSGNSLANSTDYKRQIFRGQQPSYYLLRPHLGNVPMEW